MNSAICFHGTEITCDMVSPDHADAKGFIYKESEIKPKACHFCGNNIEDYASDDIFCGKCGEEMDRLPKTV